MIEPENAVFSRVATALRAKYTGIDVQSRLTLSPAKFPCVCIEEIKNSIYRKSSDSGSIENHADVTFETNVYTNDGNGSKTKAAEIMETVDTEFCRMGFARTGKIPVKMDDTAKYRLRALYRGVVDKNNTVYRR